MTFQSKKSYVLCNKALRSNFKKIKKSVEFLDLDYLTDNKIKIRLDGFVEGTGALPDRILDLLELSAYVFAIDRKLSRGPNNAVVFDSWSREIEIAIKVRDAEFWNNPISKKKLSDLLVFITGDRKWNFTFIGGHNVPPKGLFDNEKIIINHDEKHHVMLFSGGLDSLAGAIEILNTTADIVYLTSHKSSYSSTNTQNRLVKALMDKYPNRVKHYCFSTNLLDKRAVSETQRTRPFLYGSIAFALSFALNQDEVNFYENGITSMNFPRRQDLLNSRASRTTHSKTMTMLSDFYSHIADRRVIVKNNYQWKTKSEILNIIKNHNEVDLIPSSVTCSTTVMEKEDGRTHCGKCFQCIDRRFAASASNLSDDDYSELYSTDFIKDSITDAALRIALLDYIRLGIDFSKMSKDAFVEKYLTEISETVELLNTTEEQCIFIDNLYSLVSRFGNQTVNAMGNYYKHSDFSKNIKPKSLMDLINNRDYLKKDVELLANNISSNLNRSIPLTFKKNQPKDENDFNDKVEGLIKSRYDDYRREFPTSIFSLAKVVSDHEIANHDLLIESKYLRGGTYPSQITDQIASDIVKYSEDKFILFVIYDPERAIKDDIAFSNDIENKRKCKVSIIR